MITNADGTPVRMASAPTTSSPAPRQSLQTEGLSGDDCTEAALDQFAKFGFFRTALPTYDRQVGSTQEGRQYYANRWNIWKETIQKDRTASRCVDDNGNPFPSRSGSARRGPSPTT